MELKHYRLPTIEPHKALLIVPYGIETISLQIQTRLLAPFNRTLWN